MSDRKSSGYKQRMPIVSYPAEVRNRMWFSMLCTLIDNDTRHYSGQNVVDWPY